MYNKASFKEAVTRSQLILSTGFFLVIALVYFTYWPLLSAPFVLDDFSNLDKFKAVAAVNELESMAYVVFSNTSGPTGRPMSMASFLISDFTWPTDPGLHRLVNLHIHALNGILLFALLNKLLMLARVRHAAWVSLLALTLWFISPINGNVIHSVVQRMTSLSALFGLLAVASYVKLRIRLADKNLASIAVGLLRTLILIICSLLSKESGYLFFGYILIVEYFFIHFIDSQKYQPARAWYLFVRFVLFGYLLSLVALHTNYLSDASYWTNRSFGPMDRIASQFVIIPQYAIKALLFRVEGTGIIQGDPDVSVWMTKELILQAGAFWFLVSGLIIKLRSPAVIAILWFLNAHLIESLFVPLELYFEHRNYIGIFGLYAFLAYYVIRLVSFRRLYGLPVFLTLAILSYTQIVNWQLMSDPLASASIFASENPESPRAVASLAQAHIKVGNRDKALEVLEQAELPSLEYWLSLLRCNGDAETEFEWVDMSGRPIAVAEATYVRNVVAAYRNGKCNIRTSELTDYIENILERGDLKDRLRAVIAFELALVYVEERDLNQAVTTLDRILLIEPKQFVYETKARWLASAGLKEMALDALNDGLSAKPTCRLYKKPCQDRIQSLIESLK